MKLGKVLNTVNVLKFQTLSVFVIRAGIHKMLVRMANRQDLDQTASALFV